MSFHTSPCNKNKKWLFVLRPPLIWLACVTDRLIEYMSTFRFLLKCALKGSRYCFKEQDWVNNKRRPVEEQKKIKWDTESVKGESRSSRIKIKEIIMIVFN